MKLWIRRIVWALASAAAAIMIAVYRGFSLDQTLTFNASCLSDGFFVIGLILTGIGGLTWVSTTGFFDIMSYAVKSCLVLFSPLKKPKEHPSFFDYKEAQSAKRGKPRFAMLILGVVFMAVSLACLGIYYS